MLDPRDVRELEEQDRPEPVDRQAHKGNPVSLVTLERIVQRVPQGQRAVPVPFVRRVR